MICHINDRKGVPTSIYGIHPRWAVRGENMVSHENIYQAYRTIYIDTEMIYVYLCSAVNGLYPVQLILAAIHVTNAILLGS